MRWLYKVQCRGSGGAGGRGETGGRLPPAPGGAGAGGRLTIQGAGAGGPLVGPNRDELISLEQLLVPGFGDSAN